MVCFLQILDSPLPEMGVKDPDSLRSEDINRVLNTLFAEAFTESTLTLLPPSLVERSYFEDRRKYYTQLASKITETKKNFIKKYNNIKTNIEASAIQMISCAIKREEELKAELSRMAEEKLFKWNQQLAICSDAIRFLKNWDADRGHGSNFPDSLWNHEVSEEMDFVEAGELRFDPGSYEDMVQALQTWGKITSHRDGDLGLGPLRSIIPKFVIGETGLEPGQFSRPWGVCSDATGRILVCDRSNHRIQIFNECGEFIFQFGKEGSKPGEFNRPTGIDVDEHWRIIVADKDNHRVQVFTYTGHFLFEFGCQGSKPGQFMYPWDVATNKNCDIAVSDSKNHRIQLFCCRGCLITYLDGKKVGIESHRLALQYLDSPRGLCFRPDGKLLATDFNNHRVVLINESFTGVHYFGREGSNVREFFRPQGIACDKSGKFAVADCKNHRIQIFDERGRLLRCFGSQGTSPGEFDCPQGICFHPNRNIIVVDFSNNRVQVF